MYSTKEVGSLQYIQFQHPFNAMAAGPSGSGKTYLVRDILEHHQSTICGLNKNIIKVVWAYGISQPIYDTPLKNVIFKYIEGIPEEEDIEEYDIIIIDDLMSEIKNNKFVINLFTKGSHHNNQSAFILTQNLYYKGPIVRDLNLNSHYTIIFKSPRDKMQVMAFGKQIYPNNLAFFMSAYEQATQEPHGYLLVDLKQNTPEDLRLRTSIVPSQDTNFKYMPFAFILK